MVVLGEEILAPFSKANEMGEPVFTLPAHANKPTPYLSYSSGAYLGQVVQYLLRDSKTPIHLERVYETDMAEGLKAMALEGHGIAFLPESAVLKEVRDQKLAQIRLPLDMPLEVAIEIRAYREKPQQFRNTNKTADELWNFLCAKEVLC